MFDFVKPIDFAEIHKLHEILDAAGIPHTFEKWADLHEPIPEDLKLVLDGWQLCYPTYDPEERVLSAVMNQMSYGHEGGMIEIQGLLTEDEKEFDCVRGWLSAEEVYARILKHWQAKSDNVDAFDAKGDT